jgi:hypothetical protein
MVLISNIIQYPLKNTLKVGRFPHQIYEKTGSVWGEIRHQPYESAWGIGRFANAKIGHAPNSLSHQFLIN